MASGSWPDGSPLSFGVVGWARPPPRVRTHLGSSGHLPQDPLSCTRRSPELAWPALKEEGGVRRERAPG
eukprot:13649789-Alexandrium_andersonii.AAC.1